MAYDPKRAHDYLMERARNPSFLANLTVPSGMPLSEAVRSPAAVRTSELAARDGLFLFHYEHNVFRELPEDWLPIGRTDLADPPKWEAGVLPERKYQGFRHDQPIGGFHPGHRAKWSTHELCHGLVGFAWNRSASPFFHALAGRLAELLPVTLWYFLDEVALQRCPIHEQDGALFRAFCPACDRVAVCRSEDPDALRRLEDGARFMDRELAAVAKSRRLGRPIPNPWASIDLSSDGVAYAGAHGPRLQSAAFQRYAEGFLREGEGWSASIETLTDRVQAVAKAIAEGEALVPLAPTPTHGKWRWILQDVAWRLYTVWHDTSGDAADTLLTAIDALSEVMPATREASREVEREAAEALLQAMQTYEQLHEEWVLPTPEEVFAAGYDLPKGYGHGVASLIDGVRSALPLSSDLLNDRLLSAVAAFAQADSPSRDPLGLRFSAFLKDHPLVEDLAKYEGALAHLGSGDENAAALGGESRDSKWRLADGLLIGKYRYDVVAAAEAVDQGLCWWENGLQGDVIPEKESCFVMGRVSGDVVVLDLSPATAAALQSLGEGAEWRLDEGEGQSLKDLGVLVPAAWREISAPS